PAAAGRQPDEDRAPVLGHRLPPGQVHGYQPAHDPGDVARGDEQGPGQLARRHAVVAAVELHEDVELGKREALGYPPPDLPQHEPVRLQQPYPHREGQAAIDGGGGAAGASRPRAHSTATASISTLAPSSSSDLTSTSVIAG